MNESTKTITNSITSNNSTNTISRSNCNKTSFESNLDLQLTNTNLELNTTQQNSYDFNNALSQLSENNFRSRSGITSKYKIKSISRSKSRSITRHNNSNKHNPGYLTYSELSTDTAILPEPDTDSKPDTHIRIHGTSSRSISLPGFSKSFVGLAAEPQSEKTAFSSSDFPRNNHHESCADNSSNRTRTNSSPKPVEDDTTVTSSKRNKHKRCSCNGKKIVTKVDPRVASSANPVNEKTTKSTANAVKKNSTTTSRSTSIFCSNSNGNFAGIGWTLLIVINVLMALLGVTANGVS